MQKLPFFGLSTFQLLAYLRRGLFYSFLSIYLHFFLGMSVTESTLFATFSMIGSSLLQSLVWGRVSDKLFNRKNMVVWGELIAGIGHVLIWGFHRITFDMISPLASAWVITIGLTIVEIFWSASNVAWSGLLSDLNPAEERSSIMGILSAIGGVGRIIGVIFSALLISTGGFRGGGFFYGHLFIITALIIVITALIMYFTISDKDLLYRYSQNSNSKSELEPEQNLKPKLEKKIFELRQPDKEDNHFDDFKLKKRFFILFLISLAAINFGRNGVVLIANFFLIERFNISDANLGIYESGLSLAIIVGGLITPFLIKRFGDWRVYFLTALLAVISLLSFVNVSFLFLSFIFGSGLWIAHVTIESTSYGIVSSIIPPEIRGKYFGYYNTTFFLSWGLGGTFLTGPIADYFINTGVDKVLAYTYAFYAAAVLVIAGIIVGLLLYKKRENFLV